MGKLSIGDKLIVQEPFSYSDISCNNDKWFDRGDVLSTATFSVTCNGIYVALKCQGCTRAVDISLSNLEYLITVGVLTIENRRENA